MVDQAQWHVTSFYRFIPISEDRIDAVRDEIKLWMEEHSLRGLVLVAPEGINGTVAGGELDIEPFKDLIGRVLKTNDVRFKDSVTETRPFRRITVDRRTEIVGLKRPDLVPEATENQHLTPTEWHEMLTSEEPPIVIDTRNRYETMAGKFKGAIDPDLGTFSDWSDYLKSADLPRDKPILIYCTGGIRCEKAILEMRSRGFEEVYQLRDGILGYLTEYPNGEFEGECFVFDDRVTVDQNLQPTGNYGICPGCGLTASEKVICAWCQKEYFECKACQGNRPQACSKPCLDRLKKKSPRGDL